MINKITMANSKTIANQMRELQNNIRKTYILFLKETGILPIIEKILNKICQTDTKI